MSNNFSQHKNILLQILKDIYTDTSISPFLGFKGGTAAYFFYDLNRDSFDLDFDLLSEDKEEIIFKRIKQIISNYGKIIESRIKQFNVLNIISYNKVSQNIKIDISKRNFGSQYEIKELLGISMLVMLKKDMFANKLVAMFQRLGKTNRDIFDVWFFLKNNWPINNEIVEKRLGLSLEESWRKSIEHIENISARNLLVGLGESLTDSQKDWARAKLKSEVVFLLKARIESEK